MLVKVPPFLPSPTIQKPWPLPSHARLPSSNYYGKRVMNKLPLKTVKELITIHLCQAASLDAVANSTGHISEFATARRFTEHQLSQLISIHKKRTNGTRTTKFLDSLVSKLEKVSNEHKDA